MFRHSGFGMFLRINDTPELQVHRPCTVLYPHPPPHTRTHAQSRCKFWLHTRGIRSFISDRSAHRSELMDNSPQLARDGIMANARGDLAQKIKCRLGAGITHHHIHWFQPIRSIRRSLILRVRLHRPHSLPAPKPGGLQWLNAS